jgi:hypothetical protein
MPTQNAASDSDDPHVAVGSTQVPLTEVNEFAAPVSAYPDQLVLLICVMPSTT